MALMALVKKGAMRRVTLPPIFDDNDDEIDGGRAYRSRAVVFNDNSYLLSDDKSNFTV